MLNNIQQDQVTLLEAFITSKAQGLALDGTLYVCTWIKHTKKESCFPLQVIS